MKNRSPKSADKRILQLEKELAAKNRELQIEAALEKVRSRSLAMHKSDELKEVIIVVFEKLKELGLDFQNSGIQLYREGSKDIDQWVASTNILSAPVLTNLPYIDKDFGESEIIRGIWIAKEKGKKIYNKNYSLDEKNKFFEYAAKYNDFDQLPEKAREAQKQALDYTPSLVAERHSALWVDSYSGQTISPEGFNVLERTAKVFDQAYTRFLDLQKAEAQAREAQIQLALERVRARTMAMHNSSELADTTVVLFQQFMNLGITPKRCLIGIMDKKNQSCEFFYTGFDGKVIPSPDLVPMNEQENLKQLYNAWLKKKDHLYFKLVGQQRVNWTTYIMNKAKMHFPEYEPDKINLKQISSVPAVFNTFFFTQGFIMLHTVDEIPEPEISMLKRFSGVFEQTYTRFLDLQKAEAQARESEIQLALERVRARTMAMQKSEEMNDTAALLFRQVSDLGIRTWTTGFNVWSDDGNSWLDYVTNPEGGFIEPYTIDATQYPFNEVSEAKKRGEEFFVRCEEGEKLAETYRQLTEFGEKQYKVIQEIGFEFPSKQYEHFVFGSSVSLMFITYEPVPESHDIFKRFGKVFEQTYTRFLDLQKAEAQAREATIEAALERIRSRSLAMQGSDELKDVVAVLFEKLKELGLAFDGGAGIHLFTDDSRDAEIWVKSPEVPVPVCSKLPYDEVFANNPIIIDVWKAKKTGEDIINKTYSFQDKNEYFDYVFKHNDTSTLPSPVRRFIKDTESYTATFIAEKNSLLGANSWTRQLFSESDIVVFKRVAKVFEQAYVRFLDLQKAEAQAREARIEAALERIRAKTMAMHESAQLAETAKVFFEQFDLLGQIPDRMSIGIFKEESNKLELWVTDQHGNQVNDEYFFSLDEPTSIAKIYKAWKDRKDICVVDLTGEELARWLQYVKEKARLPIDETKIKGRRVQQTAFFSKGCLLFTTHEPVKEQTMQLLVRFARVFDLTYTRFLDLQKAEANAREAVRQASVDRVRAEIASMRTIKDLEKITPLIWNELSILHIPFIRCGVFIMNEEEQQMNVHLSTPEGKAIAAFHLPYNISSNFSEIVHQWHHKESYISHWNKEEFNGVADSLVEQGAVATKDAYLDSLPKEGIYLHFLPFLQGMLYVGNVTKLGREELDLIQSVADAFSTAYARYEDFNKLEAAKKQVDFALNELQATQKQLIQSEKMASLGELTAGIAHEIQNPLNFVNNFSEVNRELILEMKEEIDKGNLDEVKMIAADIEENEEKINHHGKRADAIVKGMLQHSRLSTGVKEPTHINALADEYLRLSYHGLRAKDKSFNVVIKTDFDPTIGKINIIPQDIGRVLLNLYNNAFYACTQRSRSAVNKEKSENLISYQPTVSVSTKKSGNSVIITVSDNGNGIPQKIVDKIFQPFFTTKPTGEGTGLGLSLSYDIVKAHGGEIKVESKEGEGAHFIIVLPYITVAEPQTTIT